METAQYPEKKCREPLFSGTGLGYTCELVLMHPGPCATPSISTTVEQRDAWEMRNPEWRKDIGQHDIEV